LKEVEMEIGVMKARPPHIRFVKRAVEDRNASLEAGHMVHRDQDYVILTPQGSRDSVEKPVADWLANCVTQVREERMPAEWAEKFHASYDHWKRGEELPVDGTALANWPAITPGELQSCKNIHILTVEDLSVANDEAIRRLGMGGLELKKRAKTYLEAAAGPGKIVAANEALKAQLKASEQRRESLEVRVTQLEALVRPTSPVHTIAVKEGVEERL
jgi:hypothetical protein